MGWGDYFTVPKDIYEKRLNTCNECEHYDKPNRTCTKCGCYMEYKAKLRIVACPLLKWGTEEKKKNVG